MSSRCLFCRIRDRQEPVHIVYEDDKVLVFEDINPKAPLHLLLIPKKHYASLNEVSEEDEALLGRLLVLAPCLAGERGINKTGYRLVINTGPDSGQEIFHLHMHLLGGRRFSWPPG